MRTRSQTALCLALVLGIVSAGSPAYAKKPSKAAERKACAAAAVDGQKLLKDGKLRQARDRLLECAKASCPKVVRSDCEEWLSETENKIPSIVLGAVDDSGNDLVDVKVKMDGETIAEKLDGQSIEVDPGEHELVFIGPDDEEKKKKIVAREGKKDRMVRVAFKKEKPKDAEPAAAETTEPPAEDDSEGSSPVVGYVLMGVGVAAVGVGGFFYFSAKSDIDELSSTCAPRCAQGDVDAVNTKIIVSGMSATAGVVALGIGTYLVLSSPGKKKHEGHLSAGVVPTRGGAMFGLGGSF